MILACTDLPLAVCRRVIRLSMKDSPIMWGLICQNSRGEEELVEFVHHEPSINEETQRAFYVGASNSDPRVYTASI